MHILKQNLTSIYISDYIYIHVYVYACDSFFMKELGLGIPSNVEGSVLCKTKFTKVPFGKIIQDPYQGPKEKRYS